LLSTVYSVGLAGIRNRRSEQSYVPVLARIAPQKRRLSSLRASFFGRNIVDATRTGEVEFTAAYIEIEGTYLVPAGSPFHEIEDVDRENVRIGISENSAYDLFLTRTMRRAELIRAPGPDAAFELLMTGRVDVLAGVKQHLIAHAAKLPGSRLLPGRFMAIEQALGLPRGRTAGARYLREFIEDVKASGLVARALENAGVSGVSVAAAARSQ
jgi:polar amino acid transport system substrate-binding protein